MDWHALRSSGRDDIFDLMLKLAREYGLALRVFRQSWIEKVQSQELPSNDYDLLDSYLLDPATKSARFALLLRKLPEGLSEWAVHRFDIARGAENCERRGHYSFGLSGVAGRLEEK
jgi:hypothetical protein